VTLRQLYERADAHADLFNVAEGLLDFDQALQAWRMRHLLLVYRQIGAGTPSLKGKPSELLAEGMKHRFFPELWSVRDELFDEWTRTHPHGADGGYHG
jgi:tryptophan 2,3-dioxygenase